MNFEFTDEQKLFAEQVRRFALAQLAKDALARAHQSGFPFDVAKLMSAQGLMGITLAQADGGQGGSLMDAIIAIEQVAAVCPRSADVVQFGNFGPIRTFAEYGTPAENVLLGPGGFKKQMASFNVERLGNASRALALGRYAYTTACAYAATRKQFGRPLCEFQGLQWKFAEMAIKLESAQLLLYRAAANADRGLPSAYETAVAKVACNQAGFEIASEAAQIMGAMGYSRASLVE